MGRERLIKLLEQPLNRYGERRKKQPDRPADGIPITLASQVPSIDAAAADTEDTTTLAVRLVRGGANRTAPANRPLQGRILNPDNSVPLALYGSSA